jgi:hypothetical protein
MPVLRMDQVVVKDPVALKILLAVSCQTRTSHTCKKHGPIAIVPTAIGHAGQIRHQIFGLILRQLEDDFFVPKISDRSLMDSKFP